MKHDFFADEAKIDKYEKENKLGIYAELEDKPAKKVNTEMEETEETETETETETKETETETETKETESEEE